eukprot:Awhi_evm1s3374
MISTDRGVIRSNAGTAGVICWCFGFLFPFHVRLFSLNIITNVVVVVVVYKFYNLMNLIIEVLVIIIRLNRIRTFAKKSL